MTCYSKLIVNAFVGISKVSPLFYYFYSLISYVTTQGRNVYLGIFVGLIFTQLLYLLLRTISSAFFRGSDFIYRPINYVYGACSMFLDPDTMCDDKPKCRPIDFPCFQSLMAGYFAGFMFYKLLDELSKEETSSHATTFYTISMISIIIVTMFFSMGTIIHACNSITQIVIGYMLGLLFGYYFGWLCHNHWTALWSEL